MSDEMNFNARCSFCNKTADQVERLFTGANGVCICNECVTLCEHMLHDYSAKSDASVDVNVPKPKEIKAKVNEESTGQEQEKKCREVTGKEH